MSSNWTYEDGIRKLMSLQSSSSVRVQLVRDRIAGKPVKSTVEEMAKLLPRIGIPLLRLDELSVIHVAGTKGKGSTMCECILRRHGLRTGFFSGPHLVEPRERIRLDGQPLSQDKFTGHLQRVYTRLQQTQENKDGMPSFFMLMTLMAFQVFLEEKVDVVVVEVGVGGADDATNVLRKVPVVGITSLALDHTNVLGTSLSEIAAHKAGIMKCACAAYTVPQHHHAMRVLTETAERVKCSLTVVPSLSSYTFPLSEGPILAVDVPTYQSNASLAIQLAHAWLTQAGGLRTDTGGPILRVPQATAEGLAQFHWPGRYHVVEHHFATFYLDAAHTAESIRVCAKWFINNCDSTSDMLLMYSNTPDRNVESQFQHLKKIPFKKVYFVAPTVCKGSLSQDNQETYDLLHQKYTNLWNKDNYLDNVEVFECVDDAFTRIRKRNEKPSVLITGSIYLIGAVLSVIDRKSLLL